MIKSQKKIFKFILIFSVLINVFLLAILFPVIRDSISGNGNYYLEGRSFWYFAGIIAAYCFANFYFIRQLLKNTTENEPENSIKQ